MEGNQQDRRPFPGFSLSDLIAVFRCLIGPFVREQPFQRVFQQWTDACGSDLQFHVGEGFPDAFHERRTVLQQRLCPAVDSFYFGVAWSKARVNPTDDAGRIAWKLWWYVNRTRNVARFFYSRSLAASRHEGGWEKYLKESLAQRRQARRSEEPAHRTEATEAVPPEHPKDYWSELEEEALRLFRQSDRDRLQQKEEKTKASQETQTSAPEVGWSIEEEAALLEDFGRGSARQWWSVARRL